MPFRELLREYPGIPRVAPRMAFHSESVFFKIGVVPRFLNVGRHREGRREGQGNPNGGLAKGGLARKGPIGPKRALSGQFLLFPRGCGVQRNWSRSAPKRPRPALKWRQFGPKRPDFPGRISPRFSLKIWGLSPRL